MLAIALLLSLANFAQDKCFSFTYQQKEKQMNAATGQRAGSAEDFMDRQLQHRGNGNLEGLTIRIPVVVHILYHSPAEKISDAQVNSQIAALNNYFRRRNADTINAPAYFRALGADCEIEFYLATSDPRRRSPNGITRTYTPIAKWGADDKMKFSSETGVDAWDTKSYLNIWVCNLDKFAGYASFPGVDEKKDGLVISYLMFGTNNSGNGYSLGKTAVHEIGHWLGLKHTWGDDYCGDDKVDDTPKQASYTIGCPSGVRITCNNAPYGDMYMNFMDLTNDVCVNMFTRGQKARMRSLFEPGGVRNSLLSSKGLDLPLFDNIPLPGDDDPKWLHPQLFPNPAQSTMTLDLSYDFRWVGQTIFIMNLQGQSVMNVTITSKVQQINIQKLQAGVYFLAAKKADGESMKMKFVKL